MNRDTLIRKITRWVATLCALVAASPGVLVGPTANAAGVVIHTVAGTGIAGYGGDGGPAVNAQLESVAGVATDGDMTYFTDPGTDTIRSIDAGGIIDTVAGTGTGGFSGDGGPATSAQLSCPSGLSVRVVFLVADTCNHRIRMVAGTMMTVAGHGMVPAPLGDNGPPMSAMLYYPTDVEYSPSGILIADYGNRRVRTFWPGVSISTFAGNGAYGSTGDGGPATSASFECPTSVAVAPSGDVYISDSCAHRIRKVDTAGIITTIAGTGTVGTSGDGGLATQAEFLGPGELAFDASGTLLVSDHYRVRAIAGGIITTLAGTGQQGYSGDGGPAALANMSVGGLAVNAANDVFVGDSEAHRVRKIGTSVPFPDPEPGEVIAEPSGFASDGCADGTVLKARYSNSVSVRIATVQPDPQTRWVCARVDGTVVDVGGRLEITGGGVGAPTVDSAADQCATAAGNLVPGPHPAAAGAVGDPGDPSTYVPFAVDSYTDGGVVWLCVTAGTQRYRVVLPGGLGVTPPTVRFVPDVPGYHVGPGDPQPSTPSGSCGSDHPLLDAVVGPARVFLHGRNDSSTVRRLCVRTEGPVSAGGALDVDTTGTTNLLTLQTSTTDMTPCTLQVSEVTNPVLVRVRRSAGTSPASICVTVGGDALRVTVGPGTVGTPATVTWTPDPGTPGLP